MDIRKDIKHFYSSSNSLTYYTLVKFLKFRGFYWSDRRNAICSYIENKLYLPYLPSNVDEIFYENALISKEAKKKK